MFSGLNKADYEPISTEKPARIHSPDPFLRAGNPPRFCQILIPQKIVLAKPSPHFAPPHCPNTWRVEPRKKNTLSFFKRNFTPAKSEMQGVFFLSGLPSRARRWRGFRSSRIFDKVSSSEVVKTLQFCRKRHRRPKSVGRAKRVPRIPAEFPQRIQNFWRAGAH